jgi:hypothetical protein
MNPDIGVVGGSYAEECSFPRFKVYRGSGMRAACVLVGLGNAVSLFTVTGPNLSHDFAEIAKRKGIDFIPTAGSRDIWFRYRHPLAKPDIHPAGALTSSNRDDVIVDQALVFGMIEGRPRVHCARAVYDPQDGFRATPFSANGSTCKDLVVVASWSEGRALTGEKRPEAIAAKLLTDNGCVGVVIKCGPQGALVATPSSMKWITAFPSQRVWKIGSGDVFSAVFAHAWMREGLPILESACLASRVVAEYVETRLEIYSSERLEILRQQASTSVSKARDTPRDIPVGTIYLAGPFFNTAEQWLIDEARGALLDMGFSVFSPIHDIGVGPPDTVAPADLFALESCKLVLAMLNGFDSGTLFEVGYARARGIPVVGVAEATEERPLTMLIGSGCTVVNDLASGIYSACWQMMGDV